MPVPWMAQGNTLNTSPPKPLPCPGRAKNRAPDQTRNQRDAHGGYFTGLSILYTIGGILVVIGIVLWILGAVGRPVGGRKVWF